MVRINHTWPGLDKVCTIKKAASRAIPMLLFIGLTDD
jgi:hypothetical protein